MHHHPLLSVFTRELDLHVLLVLYRAEEPLSGREIARRANRSAAGTRGALRRLVDHGVVHMTAVGSVNAYTLNREHLLLRPLEAIALIPARLHVQLRAQITAWTIPPIAVHLLDTQPTSTDQLELLVIRAQDETPVGWTGQIDMIERRIRLVTGQDVLVHDLPEGDERIDALLAAGSTQIM